MKYATLLCAVILMTVMTASGVYFEERFDYPNGWATVVSGGKWMTWLGNSGDSLITNATPYYSAGSYMRLSQADDPAFSESTIYLEDDIFKNSNLATLGFSFSASSMTNQDYYLWFCSGDPAVTNLSYADSGLGGFIVNWVKPAAETNFVSLHLWNSFGIFELATEVSAVPASLSDGNMIWHDIRVIMEKNVVATTGGTAWIYLDGDFLGGVPFPFTDVDNVTTSILNCIDLYASGGTPTLQERCLVDNIFIQDTVGYTRYVAQDGNDMNDGLTSTTAWSSIAYGTWQLPAGCEDAPSTLSIAAGIYTNEHTLVNNTSWWKYGLYIRGGVSDRPNPYWSNISGAGADNTIIFQDFSTNPDVDTLQNTMGFYIRDTHDITVEDIQVAITTNMPQDAWAWYYGLFCAMGSDNITYRNCIAAGNIGWALGKPGFTMFGAQNSTLENSLAYGSGMGMNIAGGASDLTIEQNTYVGVTQGSAEGNSGIGIVMNGYSGTVSRCLVSQASRAGALAGVGDTFLSTFNCIDTNNGSALSEGNVIFSNTISQTAIFATQEGYPFRCGAGNIGYMGALGQTYYVDGASPIERGGPTLGLTPATAFKSPEDALLALWDFDGLANDPHKIEIAPGVYTNCVTLESYAVGGLYVRRDSTDRPSMNGVEMYGNSPVDTIIYGDGTLGTYKDPSNTWGRAGGGIYLRGMANWTVRDLQVQVRNATDQWGWYYGVINAAGCSNVLFSNVYVNAEGEICGNGCFSINSFGAVDNPQGDVTLDHCLAKGLSFGLNMHVMNNPAIPTTLKNCTFVNQLKSPAEGLSPAGVAWNADDTIVHIQNSIIATNAETAIAGNASAATAILEDTIVWDIPAVSDAAINEINVMHNTTDPQLAVYLGYPDTTPWVQFGWHSRPLESPVVLGALPWPLNGNDPQRKGVYASGADNDGAALVWTNGMLVGTGIWGSGVADDSLFYLATDNDPEIIAFNITDGSVAWMADLEDWVNGTPAVSVDMVFSGDNAGYAYGIDKATGFIVWKTYIGGGANGGVLLNNNRLYIEADNYGLVCLNAADGTVLWVNPSATASTWSGNGPSMNPAGDTVYYHTEGGDIIAVNAATGATVWQHTYGGGWGGQEPIVDDSGNIYCAFNSLTNSEVDDVLISFDTAGNTNWVYTLGDGAWWHGGYALSGDGATIYCSRRDGAGRGIDAVNTSDGSQKWTINCGDTLGGCVVAAPGDVVVGVFDDGGVPAAKAIRDNGASGTEMWSIPIDTTGASWSWPTILGNGNIIVESENGTIACIARINVTAPPDVDITNANAYVTYDNSTYTIGGTNNLTVVGGMTWSNLTTLTTGSIPAATPWTISGIDLAVGVNNIIVLGTNAVGAVDSDTVQITRGDITTGTPYVDITNATPITVNFGTTTYTIGVTNNASVVGTITWENALTMGSGTIAGGQATIPLAVGLNTVTVTATNALGTVATDSIGITRKGEGSGGWPRSRHDALNSCLSEADCSTMYTQSWSAPLTLIGGLVGRSGHIALDDSKVVVLAPDATLCAFSRATGMPLWDTHLGKSSDQWTVGGDPLILSDGTILVNASNHMWRVNADGSVAWSTQIRPDGWTATPVAKSPDSSQAYAMGVFGASSNALVAVDVATGIVNWKYDVCGARFGAMPVDSAGTIYFGSSVGWGGADGGADDDMSVYAINSDGTLKWRSYITNEMMQGMLLSSDESKLFFKAFNGDGKVMCLDAATGATLWKVTNGPGDAFPDLARDANDNLYGGGYNGIAKWDSDGNLVWVNDNYTSAYCPAISANGVVWFRAQNTPDLIAVNAYDGSLIAELPIYGETGGEPAWGVPAIDDKGNVYAATRSNIFCFAPTDGPQPSPWPLCGNGPQRQGHFTDGETLLNGATLGWTNTDLVGIGIWGSGVSDGERFYLPTDADPELIAYNLSDGTVAWTADLNDWCNGTPALSMDRIYVGDNAGEPGGGSIYCFDKSDGTPIWSKDLGLGNLNGGILLAGSKVYAEADDGTTAGGLFCFDAETGATLWSNTYGKAGTWSGNGPSISPDGSAVYAHNDDGLIIAIDTATGTTLWQWTFAGGWGGQEPIVDNDGNVYCQSDGLSTSADNDIMIQFSPAGATNWIFEFEMNQAMAHGGYALSADNATLYCSRRDGTGATGIGLTAIDTATGTKKWDVACGDTIGGCVVTKDNVIVGAFQDTSGIAAKGILDEGTSARVIWSVPFDSTGDSWSWPTIVDNGSVIVESDNGTIARIDPTNYPSIGWCNLQWPYSLDATVTGGVAGVTDALYGQVWIDGITSDPGATPDLYAWVGYGYSNLPPTDASWTWMPAVFNTDVGNNDEFYTNLIVTTSTPPGYYAYGFKYQYAPGTFFGETVYGQKDGIHTLATIDEGQYGVLTVVPEPGMFIGILALALMALRKSR